MSAQELSAEDTKAILDYLELPGPSLPAPPIQFLEEHLHSLPTSLLSALGSVVPPRQRTTISAIRHRRFLYASSSPPPPLLRASSGRRRWPLLWQRLGGSRSRTAGASDETREEEEWVRDNFLPGKENTQHVKKLGGFLRGLAEEREWEEAMGAQRVERQLDEQGEEFESDSDDEEDASGANGHIGLRNGGGGRVEVEEEEDQEEVERTFEKRLLELFVDGLDTIDYDEIDFTEPPEGDPIGKRDAEERYFDDEEPSRTPNGHVEGHSEVPEAQRTPDQTPQNGQGEYDY